MPATPAIYVMPATMKLEDCEALYRALRDASGQDLMLQCAAVTRLNGLAAQMIAVAARIWPGTGGSLRIADPSPGCVAGFEMLGLGAVLQDAVVPA